MVAIGEAFIAHPPYIASESVFRPLVSFQSLVKSPGIHRLKHDLICRTDVTPARDAQLPRAASLILSSLGGSCRSSTLDLYLWLIQCSLGRLGFIHDLRTTVLEPDTVRGTPLDMSQYKRLFGTSRVPTNVRQRLIKRQ